MILQVGQKVLISKNVVGEVAGFSGSSVALKLYPVGLICIDDIKYIIKDEWHKDKHIACKNDKLSGIILDQNNLILLDTVWSKEK